MRKTAVLVAVLMAASSPAFAKAKKAAPQAAPEAKPAHVVQNENSGRLFMDALPLFLPSAAQVVYLSTTQKDTSKPMKKSKK